MDEEIECAICNRKGPKNLMEEHHLLPGKHRRTKTGRQDGTIICCKDCGDQIHLMFTNQQLRRDYTTLQSLRAAMTEYCEWVYDRPLSSKVNMKRKKRKL